jgi:hypothetical protein
VRNIAVEQRFHIATARHVTAQRIDTNFVPYQMLQSCSDVSRQHNFLIWERQNVELMQRHFTGEGNMELALR